MIIFFNNREQFTMIENIVTKYGGYIDGYEDIHVIAAFNSQENETKAENELFEKGIDVDFE